MSDIFTIQRGSYKFKGKKCGSCNKLKRLDKFRYIKYFSAYRKICIVCEKKKSKKIKKEKIKFKKKYGVPYRVYEEVRIETLIKAGNVARNIILSKISSKQKKRFNLSNTIKKVVEGINSIFAILFFMFIIYWGADINFLESVQINDLWYNFSYIKLFGLIVIFLIIINKIKKIYIKKYWIPVNKKILDQKELLYPKFFKQILKDAREEFQKNENFYSSPEWREVRKQVLKSQGHTCYICNKRIFSPFDLTVDHIKPRSKYPQLALNLSNLKIACRICNSAKGAK